MCWNGIKRRIFAVNKKKEKNGQTQPGHSMSQRDCRLTGTRSLERQLCRRENLLYRNDFSLCRACDVEESFGLDAFVRFMTSR